MTLHPPIHRVPSAPLAFSSFLCLWTTGSTLSTQTMRLTASADPLTDNKAERVVSFVRGTDQRGKLSSDDWSAVGGNGCEVSETVLLSERKDSVVSSPGPGNVPNSPSILYQLDDSIPRLSLRPMPDQHNDRAQYVPEVRRPRRVERRRD